jgi:hypothetical protein
MSAQQQLALFRVTAKHKAVPYDICARKSRGAPMCKKHRIVKGENVDYCIEHKNAVSEVTTRHRIEMRRCQPSETEAAKRWLAERHYLKSAPPGFVTIQEFLSDGERVGALILGRPTARCYDADRVLELTRMYFDDAAPKNTESWALAKMRAFVRKWYPNIRLLLAYSDPNQGHRGTVYEADGWAPFGLTDEARGYGWASRNGRRDAPQSRKLRWVRTP